MRTFCLSVLLIGLVAGGNLPANADETSPAGDFESDVLQPAPAGAEPVEVEISAATIEDAREEAVEDAENGDLTAKDEAARDELVDSAAANGQSLPEEAVDVVPLMDGDVTLVVPVNVEVSSIELTQDGGELAVEAESNEIAGADISPGGPGLASWSSDGDGQYNITVKGWGTATFLWKRSKLSGDGSSTYDWYAYARKGTGQPADKDRYAVRKLRVQSYPYDSIEKGLVNWTDYDPDDDFSGKCSGSSSVSVSTPVAGFSYSFSRCEENTMWFNPDNPGSYWIEMYNGGTPSKGTKSTGYALAFKVKQGTKGSMHDFQRVIFGRLGPHNTFTYETCDAYDAGKTCNP